MLSLKRFPITNDRKPASFSHSKRPEQNVVHADRLTAISDVDFSPQHGREQIGYDHSSFGLLHPRNMPTSPGIPCGHSTIEAVRR